MFKNTHFFGKNACHCSQVIYKSAYLFTYTLVYYLQPCTVWLYIGMLHELVYVCAVEDYGQSNIAIIHKSLGVCFFLYAGEHDQLPLVPPT